MTGLAVAFGGISYFAGNHWLESQANARLPETAGAARPAVEMSTVVVASQQLRFGETLSEEKLKTVAWPKDALPEGSYETIEAVIANGGRKALKTIEPGEPMLEVKLTGEDGRAGLSGVIAEGMRAVTIPVDLVNGVGGFVMPGDRVDIVLTKKSQENGEQAAKIIMENVKVLSIDQDADRAGDVARVAKSVTLETDAEGAQKLALANSVGRLSLLLRSAGDEGDVNTTQLSAGDLDGKPAEASAGSDEGLFSFLNSDKPRTATIRVVRRDEVVSHSVPVMEQREEQQQ